PSAQHRLHLPGNEMTRAVAVVALRQQVVVIGEDVAHIGNQREPCGLFGRGRCKPLAVERVIGYGAELMQRDFRREVAERSLNRLPPHLRDGPPASTLRTRENSPAVRLTRAATASRMRSAASG